MSNDSIGQAKGWVHHFWAVLVLALVVSACDDQLEMDLMTNPAALKADQVRLPISVDKLCSDVTVTAADGRKITGTRDCKPAGKSCTKVGDVDCVMTDADLYGIHDQNLTAENVREGVTFGDKAGQAKVDHPLCTADGQQDCVVQGDMAAAERSTVAAKTLVGQTLAGEAGSHDPGYPSRSAVLDSETVDGQQGLLPSCTAEGNSSCVTTASLRSVPKSQLVASNIRQGAQIGGVPGSYTGAFTNCAGDGSTDCILSGSLRAMNPTSLQASKIRQSVTLAGVPGTLVPSPALCDGSTKTGCVTRASFPAADYNLITAGNIKKNATLAHMTTTITGGYPSASHPYVDRDGAVPDLTSTNFNSRMASATAFEYWDSAGVRHSNSGDAQLVVANLSQDATIFGVTGSVKPMPAKCSDALTTDCVTNATHVSYTKSLLAPGNIKRDAIITWGGTITGQYPSATHPLPNASVTADLKSTTFNTQVANGGVAFEYWDSTGTRKTGTGSAQLIGANLVTGTNVFGVAGTANIRPANCSATNTLSCVTTSTFPAYDPAVLTAAKIRTGVKLGLVTGTYPSAGNLIDGHDSAIADLKATTFNGQLTQAGNVAFEFWDNEGNRVQGNSNAHISAIHLPTGKTVFDVAGSLPLRSADCGGADQQDCVATTTYPSYLKADLTPAILKKDTIILGVTGDYPSATHRLTGHSAVADLGDQADLYGRLPNATAFEYWDSAGVRHQSKGDANLVATNLVDGVEVFGVTGSMVKSPNPCTAEGQQDCVTTAQYKSYDTRTFTAGLLKKDATLGGITGAYPSATFPLKDSTATKDLRGSTDFDSDITTAGSVEFFDSDGTRYVKAIPGLAASTVRQSVTLFGVHGSAVAGPAPCSATNITSCLTSTNFPAYQQNAINALHLKNAVKIGGVTGVYPSAASPLPGASSMPDLDAATFMAKIKSGASFEYWDANGQRHVGQGNAGLAAHNILLGKTIFGQAGNLRNPTLPVATSKVRVGTTVHGSTGTRKVSCANTATHSTSGQSNTDDFNNAGSMPSRQPFGANKACHAGTFVDMQSYGGSCHGSSSKCVFKDTVSGLLWHSTKVEFNHAGTAYAATVTFHDSANYCQGLTVNGGGWRVPTHKELVAATVNGMRQMNRVSQVIFPYGSRTWTGTKNSQDETKVKVVKPARHLHKEHVNTDSTNYVRVLCVR